MVQDPSRPPPADAALIQAEKLSALGRMVAAIAHEINNPLTLVLGQAHLLLQNPEVTPYVRERLEMMAAEAARATRIVENLLMFARHQPPERRPCALPDQVRWILRLAEHQLQQDGIEVVTELQDCAPVWVDENQLRQVLLNLVQNAQQSMVGQPRRVLTVRIVEREAAVVIEVLDTGPGIPEAVMPYIFDPFFTTKPSGQGTGLGLWVSYSIIEQHGGRLSARNRGEGGAAFTIELRYRKRAR